jgi:tetratricopeptide (TPR) repeat protein
MYPASGREIAESEYELATDLYRRDIAYPRAQQLAQDAQAIRSRVFGVGSVEALQARELVGNLKRVQGDWKAAETDLRPVYEQLHSRYGDHSLNTAAAAYDLAFLFFNRQSYAEADRLLRSSLEARRQLLAASDPLVLVSLEGLALSLQAEGKPEQAEQYLREVLATRNKILSPDTPGIAVAVGNLASVLQDQDAHQEAEQLYREALGIDEKLYGEEAYETAITMNDLSDLLFALERYPEAEVYARKAAAVFARLLGTDHPFAINAHDRLSTILGKEGRFSEAESIETGVMAAARRRFNSSDSQLAKYVGHMGVLRQEEGAFAQAETFFQQAFTLAESAPPEAAIRVNTALWYGEALLHRHDFNHALPLLRVSFETRRTSLPTDSVATAEAEVQLGRCLVLLGNCLEARKHLEHAYAVLQKKRGISFSATVAAKQFLDKCQTTSPHGSVAID